LTCYAKESHSDYGSVRHFLPFRTRMAFYNCLILSITDYCCVVRGDTCQKNFDKILKLQKKAARLILDTGRKAYSLPLFLQLGSLPKGERIKYVHCLMELMSWLYEELINPFQKCTLLKHTRVN
jgi:hypothetical protein